MPNPIFFYGLFMDARLLREQGLHPDSLGAAVLRGYRIHIGARATLVPAIDTQCFGMLIELPQPEVDALYAPVDVRDYRPERVEVELLEGGALRMATVYNLPAREVSQASNPDYAAQLAALVRELDLPAAYAQEIAAFGCE